MIAVPRRRILPRATWVPDFGTLTSKVPLCDLIAAFPRLADTKNEKARMSGLS
jgi:hypothetical protein